MKVLILSAGFGEGHNTAARNILAALRHLSPEGVDARIVDIFSQHSPVVTEKLQGLYVRAINDWPFAWTLAYKFMDTPVLLQSTMWLFDGFARALEELVDRERPDVICSTYPCYSHLIRRFSPAVGARPFRQVVVVTDSITVNSAWYKTEADSFIVPNPDTGKALLEDGVPPEKVLPLGFPVQLDFALPERRLAITPPGPSSPPRILYMLNSGKKDAGQIVESLLAYPGWEVTIAVGRDEALLQRLRNFTNGHQTRVKLIGWTNDMPRLLMSHHFLIGKAGGATVQEALAAGCPMIITQIVPGQEEGNYELIRRNDCGVRAHSAAEIPLLIQSALNENAAGWKSWRSNITQRFSGNSALLIAQHILSLP